MNSRTTREFRELFARLPSHFQQQIISLFKSGHMTEKVVALISVERVLGES